MPLPVLGRVVEPLYRFEIGRRNRAFDRGRGVARLDVPVISVGNLSVGGTGKTPMVARMVSWLRGAGHDPCVAMRGYRSGGGESDEASAYARAFQDLPIVARADRLAGLRELFVGERGGRVDCVVLDDGFQHRRIARDLDIVLVDASRNPFEDRLLPAGWLREPVESLSRADAVVVTHAEMMDGAMTRSLWFPLVTRLGRGKPVALARHAWTGLEVFEHGVDREEGVEWLRGKRTLAVCAIGNPRAFLRGVTSATRGAGGEDVEGLAMVLGDHDPYREGRVRAISELARSGGVEAIVTTDKDWSKLRRVPADRWPCAVVRARLEVAFDRGEADLRRAVLGAASGAVCKAGVGALGRREG